MSTYTVYQKASVFMPTNKKRLFLLLGCPFQGCPVINPVFGRLCRKTGPGGGKTRGLVPRDDVLTNGFIRFSLARTLARILNYCTCPPPPPPPRNPEGVANLKEAICVTRSDSIIGVILTSFVIVRV